MTNEEALKDFNKFVDAKTSKASIPAFVDVVIEALKKQVPTKTVEQGFIYCGKCDMKIESIGWGWCPHCGQAIDWGDGE